MSFEGIMKRGAENLKTGKFLDNYETKFYLEHSEDSKKEEIQEEVKEEVSEKPKKKKKESK